VAGTASLWAVRAYVVDATNCGRARIVDCHKILPYAVTNAAGVGVRTSTWPTGPARKPPVCKATP
jgi:hypothetical protein